MNNARIALPPAVLAWRTNARTWWQKLPARERAAVVVGASVLIVFVLWMVAIAPALRTIAAAPPELDALDQQLQSMRRLAAEASELKGTTPLPPGQAGDALKAATERLGDKARLSLQGERAVLTLQGVRGDQLRDWLSEARSGARARAVEAQLTRAPQGYSGTVVVAMGTGR